MVADADTKNEADEPSEDEQDEFDRLFGEGADDNIPDVDSLLQALHEENEQKEAETGWSIPDFQIPEFISGASRAKFLSLKLVVTALRLSVLTATLALAVTWLGIFRLASNPVDLGFLIPTFETTKASWPREARHLNITSLVVDWDTTKGALRAQAETDGSDIPLGEVASLSLSQRIIAWISADQLLSMNFKPSAAAILNPILSLNLEKQDPRSQDKSLALSTGQDALSQKISSSSVKHTLNILEHLAPTQSRNGFEMHRPIVEINGHGKPFTAIERIRIVRTQTSNQSWTLTAILGSDTNTNAFRPSGHFTLDLNAYPDRSGFDISVTFKDLRIPTEHFGIGCNQGSASGDFSTQVRSGKQLPPAHLKASFVCVQKSLTARPRSWDLSSTVLDTEISFPKRTLEFKSLQLGLSENNSISATGRMVWPSQMTLGEIAIEGLLPSRIDANLVMSSHTHDFSLIGLPSDFGIETASARASATFPAGRLEGSDVKFENINILSTSGANISGDVQIAPEVLLSSPLHLSDHDINQQHASPKPSHEDSPESSENLPAISISIALEGVDESNLAKYWPTQSGTKARTWLLNSMTKADIKTANLELDLNPTASTNFASTSGKKLKATRFVGQFAVDDMKLKLFKNASADFPHMSLVVTNELTRLSASESTVSGLRFTNVFVEAAPAHELDPKEGSFVRIQADVNSDLRQQLNFLSWEPLTVLSSLPPPILNATGFASTHIDMSWPLKQGLSWDTLKLNAYSHMASTQMLSGGHPITSDTLHATLEDKVLRLNGVGDFKGKSFHHSTRVDIKHAGTFSGETHIDTLLNLSQTNLQNSQTLTVEGIAPLRLKASYGQEEELTYGGQLDLSDVKITSPLMGWSKPSGIDAQMLFEAVDPQNLLSGEDFTETTLNLSCISANLICEAKAIISPKEELKQLIIKSLAMTPNGQPPNAQTIGRGSLNIDSDHSIDIAAHFKSLTLDIDLLKHMLQEALSSGAAIPNIDAKFNILQMSNLKGESLSNLKGQLATKNKSIEAFLFQFETATATKAAPLENSPPLNQPKESYIALTSHEDQQVLQADIEGFGNLIRFIGGKSLIGGGHVELISSQQTQPDEKAPWIFDLKLQNYVLNNTPFVLSLFKALTLGTPTDALLARGLSFSQGKAQGRYEDKRFVIDSFTSSGGNMGLSGRGYYDSRQDEISWTGEIVPLNLLNSTMVGIIGAVPIVGGIVTGDEKSGILALKYDISGPWDQPTYSSNPPSLLVPGVFRDIFFPRVPLPEAPLKDNAEG